MVNSREGELTNITAVILCGGLGTRLHTVTGDKMPKPMVDVAGRPFLELLLDDLIKQGVNKAVLAVSHHKSLIVEHFGNKYQNLEISYSIEDEPLGTGGAIKQAIMHNTDTSSEYILVLNGDTFVEYELKEMLLNIIENRTSLVMAVKPLENTDRYGRVNIDQNNRIVAFEEKAVGKSGHVNVGVYLLDKRIVDSFPPISKFSFETDFLEKQLISLNFAAYYANGYFVDIGIPEDYSKAQRNFTSN